MMLEGIRGHDGLAQPARHAPPTNVKYVNPNLIKFFSLEKLVYKKSPIFGKLSI
jgi:hypothetical protein